MDWRLSCSAFSGRPREGIKLPVDARVAGWAQWCPAGWGCVCEPTGAGVLTSERTGLVFLESPKEKVGLDWRLKETGEGTCLSLSSCPSAGDRHELEGKMANFPEEVGKPLGRRFRFRHSLVSSGLEHLKYCNCLNSSFLGLKKYRPVGRWGISGIIF